MGLVGKSFEKVSEESQQTVAVRRVRNDVDVDERQWFARELSHSDSELRVVFTRPDEEGVVEAFGGWLSMDGQFYATVLACAGM